MRYRLMRHVAIIALLAVFAIGLPSLGAQEADSASAFGPGTASRSVTIYKAECPAGYTGDASADECDANPVAGVPFRVGRPFTEAFTEFVPTDAEGLVVFKFDGLPLDGILRVIEHLPVGTEHFVAYCVNEGGDVLDISYPDYAESSPDIGVADVAVGESGNVACDWYNVPEPTPMTSDRPAPCASGVRLVGEAHWRAIPPEHPDDEGARERLWFEVLVENCTREDALGVDVVFGAYEADGTWYGSCGSFFGIVTDAAKNIAPGDRAWATCDGGTIPHGLNDLQVTANIRDVYRQPEEATSVDYEVTEVDFMLDEMMSSTRANYYLPSALVQSTLNEDILITLLFRLYDDDGIQVGVCESSAVIAEPYIWRSATCFAPVRIDATSHQPARVRAVPLSCDVRDLLTGCK